MSASAAAKTGFVGGLGALMGGWLGSQVGLAMLPQPTKKERKALRRSWGRGPSGVTWDRLEYQVAGAVIGGGVGGLLLGAAAGAGLEETPKKTAGALHGANAPLFLADATGVFP